MNKHIYELATKAGMVMYPTGIGISENTIWGDRNIEKFAELIIQECEELNRQQSYELQGVVFDVKNGYFDVVCLDTVKSVSGYLDSKSLMKHFENDKHFVVESSLLKAIKS